MYLIPNRYINRFKVHTHLSICLSDVTVWLQHEAVVWLSVFSHPETEREERKRHSSETFIKPDPEDLKRTHTTLRLSFISWTVGLQSLLE